MDLMRLMARALFWNEPIKFALYGVVFFLTLVLHHHRAVEYFVYDYEWMCSIFFSLHNISV